MEAYSRLPPTMIAAFPVSLMLANAFNAICGSRPDMLTPSYSLASALPKGGLAITASYSPSKGSAPSCEVTSRNPCSRRLARRVSSSSLAWTRSAGIANTSIPFPAVGSRTEPVLPGWKANISATKAIGSGVEYCCIFILVLLRCDMVGCIS